MREIKFDAIYKPTGEHFTPYKINFQDNTTFGDFDGQENDWCHFSLDGKYGDAILRQYTGLKDKNGKEIYEGDLIKKKFKDRKIGEFYAVGQVVFGHWYAGFTVPYNYHGYNKLERLSSSCDKDGWFVANRDMEVIGNIYENPELIKD